MFGRGTASAKSSLRRPVSLSDCDIFGPPWQVLQTSDHDNDRVLAFTPSPALPFRVGSRYLPIAYVLLCQIFTREGKFQVLIPIGSRPTAADCYEYASKCVRESNHPGKPNEDCDYLLKPVSFRMAQEI